MNEPWVPKLTQIVQARVEKKEPFKRGELTGIFKELATEFNVENPDKLMNYYYRVLKKSWTGDSATSEKKPKKVKKKDTAPKETNSDGATSKKATNAKKNKTRKDDSKTNNKEDNKINNEVEITTNNSPQNNKEEEANISPSGEQTTKSSLNEIKFVTSKPDIEPIKLTFLKNYPAPTVPINTYEEESEPTTEWLNYSQINRNIEGETFNNYVKTLQNGELIKKGSFNNKELEIIEINALKRILGTFSGYSRNKRVKEQAQEISTILNADETMTAQKREEYYFNSLEPNTLVEVEVKKIMEYGGICFIIDYPNLTGILHIGQLTKGFVKNIQEYLYEGQRLTVQVLKKEKNRLEFTTKHLDLRPIEDVKKEDFNFKETASTVEDEELGVEESSYQNSETEEEFSTKQLLLDNTNEATTESKVTFEKTLENANLGSEWNRIVEYVKGAVGPLSPDAKKKAVSIINEYGIFDFALALQSTSREFKADMGLLLLRETETKLREGLNDFQYKVKDHAVSRYIQRLRLDRESYVKKHNKGVVPKNEDACQRLFESIVKQEMLYNLSESTVVIDTDTHRYVTHRGLWYPCQKIQNGNSITYLARTVLTQRMVEKNFDELILEKYDQD